MKWRDRLFIDHCNPLSMSDDMMDAFEHAATRLRHLGNDTTSPEVVAEAENLERTLDMLSGRIAFPSAGTEEDYLKLLDTLENAARAKKHQEIDDICMELFRTENVYQELDSIRERLYHKEDRNPITKTRGGWSHEY